MTFIGRVLEDCCAEWRDTKLYVIMRTVDWTPLIAIEKM